MRVLQLNKVAYSTKIVAQMQVAGGAYAAQNFFHAAKIQNLASPIHCIKISYLCTATINLQYMQVDDALVVKLAELSKLEFAPEEMEGIKSDLNKILTFMEKLNELNTDDVEPLIYVNEDVVNVFRDDIIQHPISKEEALSNAALKDSDYIKVPKFVTHRS